MDGAAYGRGSTTMGNKNDVTLVNPRCGKADKRRQAVDIKFAREISASGRMAGVGRHIAECRVWVKSVFVFDFWCFGVPRIRLGEMVCSHPVFIALGGLTGALFHCFFRERGYPFCWPNVTIAR